MTITNYMLEDLREVLGENHVVKTEKIFQLLMALHLEKEKQYDRSFAKRGLIGVFMNVGRKIDAAETYYHKGNLDTAEMMDTLGDLAVYCVKLIEAMRIMSPDEFRKWVENDVSKFIEGIEVKDDYSGHPAPILPARYTALPYLAERDIIPEELNES